MTLISYQFIGKSHALDLLGYHCSIPQSPESTTDKPCSFYKVQRSEFSITQDSLFSMTFEERRYFGLVMNLLQKMYKKIGKNYSFNFNLLLHQFSVCDTDYDPTKANKLNMAQVQTMFLSENQLRDPTIRQNSNHEDQRLTDMIEWFIQNAEMFTKSNERTARTPQKQASSVA
ncbi:hypothetical protein RF11_15838 [Thelohanellus kitauei]|uniref:Uncharacterized protein n=1 Tax=Thelohanellus kitauei TaxID=669202 RepID=A0A0C2MBP9_THEKT|nr:hypothetical protein RF11_15838 [Thelohanellus kitauei]